MQRTKVLWLFLLEAALLGAAGTFAGAAVGTAAALLVDSAHIAVPESVQMFLMQQHLTLLVKPGLVAGSVGVITAITTVAALYPAWHAARLEPVTAMHHIG